MFVRAPSSQVYLGPDSFIHGSLIAPTATFVMMSGSTLVGAAYAQSIDVAETAQFTCHSLSEDLHPAGRAVKTLADGSMGPGMHTLQWDGTNDGGTRLGSGVYFYRITAGPDRAQRKLVIVD